MHILKATGFVLQKEEKNYNPLWCLSLSPDQGSRPAKQKIKFFPPNDPMGYHSFLKTAFLHCLSMAEHYMQQKTLPSWEQKQGVCS